jgi:nucleoside-triphosphatase
MQSAKNLLLTGKPGSGKTTALIAAVKLIGMRAGGFYTQEVREKGERIGFNIVTLSGRSRMMASKGFRSPRRVGSYGVDVEAIDTLAAGSIEEAIEKDDLIVIDEIGKMELFSDVFRRSILKALDSPKPVIGVIMEKHDEFADKVKARADVKLIGVTHKNRDEVPALLKAYIEGL